MALLNVLIKQQNTLAKFGQYKYKVKKPERLGYSAATEITYRKQLRELALYLTSLVEKHLFVNLNKLIKEAKRERFDDYTDTLDSIVQTIKDEFGDRYTEEEIRRLASNEANAVSNFNRNRLTRILSNAIGVNVFLTEPYLQTSLNSFIKDNVALIKSIPAEHLKEVEFTIKKAIRSGKTTAETEKEIRTRWADALKDKPKNRAELIARDQNGKFYGEINQLRQTELGVKKYIWRTVRDARVRDSHADKEGRIFSWDKPPSDTGHPGEDYQCRCYAEPVLTDLAELEEAA